jgi:hypothetical protein
MYASITACVRPGDEVILFNRLMMRMNRWCDSTGAFRSIAS